MNIKNKGLTRMLALVLAVILCGTTLVMLPVKAADDKPLSEWFSNATVAEYVGGLLGKSQSDPVSQQDLDTITTFSTQNQPSIVMTSINEIAPLRNLTRLWVINQEVENLDGITNFTKLIDFRATNLPLKSLAGLENVPTITELEVSEIHDPAFTANENVLAPISALTDLNWLIIRNTDITSRHLEAIGSLDKLTTFNATNNKIDHFAPFTKFTNMVTLSLSNNALEDITGVSTLTHLTALLIDNDNPYKNKGNRVIDYAEFELLRPGTTSNKSFDMMRTTSTQKLVYLKSENVYVVDLDIFKPFTINGEPGIFTFEETQKQANVVYNATKNRVEIAAEHLDDVKYDNLFFGISMRNKSNQNYGQIFVYADPPIKNTYTITYRDGSSDESYFKTQTFNEVEEESTTPAFVGTPERTGYTFKGWSPTVASVVSDDAEYIAQWEIIPKGRVIVNHEDEQGQTVHPSQTLSGDVGTNYQANPQTVTGYTFLKLKDDSAPQTGVYGETDLTVTFVYKKDILRYTITYRDGSGDESYFKTQTFNDVVEGTTTPAFVGTPERTGYTFKGWSPTLASEVSGDAEYIAQWEIIPKGIVIVNHEDEQGQTVHPSQTLSGDVGTNYQANPQTVTGYTFLKLKDDSAPQTGVHGDTPLTVTFVYQKDAKPLPDTGVGRNMLSDVLVLIGAGCLLISARKRKRRLV